jgi:hypothetical protein
VVFVLLPFLFVSVGPAVILAFRSLAK